MQWDRHQKTRIKPAIVAAMLTGIAALLPIEKAAAQPQLGNLLPQPRLAAVTPGGGKVDSTVEVTFSGLDLEEPKELVFSHPGIKATAIIPPAPQKTPKADPKKPAPKPMPQQTAITKFKVTIGESVPVGTYDVRLVNKWGISNARAFVVGDLAEVAEKEPNNDVDQAQRVEINSTINGTIAAPTDVDYFVFAGKQGQRVVVSCLASSIDSRLNADLRLFDADDKQLASSREYNGSDALLDATLPSDGDYYVRLCHFTYSQGNPEYFYRLSITTAPWIDAVHPPMIEPGKSAQVTVYGRNLPGGKLDKSAKVDGRPLEKITVTIKAPDDKRALHRLAYSGFKNTSAISLDGFEYRIRNDSGTSNPVLLTYARAPVVLDNEANDTAETAQAITLPCEIAGRIEKRRDRDWYEFSVTKGETYSIEVYSDRLGAPTDMYFLLRNLANKQETEVDAHNEILTFSFKFYAMTDDPGVYTFTAAADGKYQLMLASHIGDTLAGPRHCYRVRITQPQPDFHVAVMPPDNYRNDSCTLRQGGNAYYNVFVWRHDGFTGDVTLEAEDLPKGVTCTSQVIGSGVKSAKIVVSADADAPEWTGEIKFKARATIKGKTVEREARPVSITWPVQPQQNIRVANRFEQGLALAVRDKPPYSLTTDSAKATVTQGGKVTVGLKLARLWPDFKNQVQIVPDVREIPKNANAGSLVLNINPSAQPGTYNMVFRSFAPVPFNKDPMAKAKPNVNVVQCSTPVAVTILPKQVATVSVNNTNPTVKLGMQTEIVLSVNRLFNYDGEFKVQLVLPANIQGLSADEVTIPAGKNEVKLAIMAAANAALGNRSNLTVKTTALYNGTVPLVQESKINVNVIK
jgi:hypothetical protein